MTEPASERSPHDRQVDALIAELELAAEQGRPLDREDFLKQHAEFAVELREYLDDVGRFHAAVQPYRSEPEETEPVSGSTPRMLPPGTRKVHYFGDYEILEELGSGGMGVVYKARQQKLKRTVALKMIKRGQFASEEEVKRFQAEARAAAKLDHPGIVGLLEVGLHHGEHFYAMDFVAGGSLSALYREQPVAARHAADLVKKLAEAMHYAHGEGIVHRDLKPANVLLTTTGAPRITDFGLALRMRSDDDSTGVTMTQTGQVLGTAGYMSPEQAAGKTGLVNTPTDIYSLGAILYALLTSRAPFVGDSPSVTILQVLNNEPVPLRALNPSVPRDLETICLKCLEKEPHKRYGTAQLLADDLGRFLEGRPVIARPISLPARGWRWCRRNPLIAGLSAAVAASLLVGTIVSSVLAVIAFSSYTESERQRNEVATAKDVIQKNYDDLEKKENERIAALKEANWQLYRMRVTRMEQLWREKDWGSLDRLLTESAPAPGEDDLRGWEWHFLNSQVANRFWRVNARARENTPFDWDRTTGRLAVLVPGKVEIWLPSERRLVKSIDIPDLNAPSVVAWSPDHRRLAVVATYMKVHVIDTSSGTIDCTLPEPEGWSGEISNSSKNYLTNLHWSPHSDCLAVTRAHERIRLWKLTPKPQMIALLEAESGAGPKHIHWVEKDLCVTTSTRGDMQFWDTTEWKPLRSEKVVQGYCHDAAWSPDGKRVALASARVVIANAEGTQVKSLPDQGTWIEKLCWLDNERLITGNAAHEVRIVHIDQAVPDEVYRLHASKIQSVCQGPEGQIASAAVGDVVKVWSPGEVASEHIVFPDAVNLPIATQSCAWHPTKNTLAMVLPGQATTIGASWSPADAQAVSIPFAEDVSGVQWNGSGDVLTLELQSGNWKTLPWPYVGASSIVYSPQEMGPLHAYSADRRFRVERQSDWYKIELVDLHGQYTKVAPNTSGIYTFAWHPREPRLAITEHGRIHLLDPCQDPPTRASFGYSDRLQAAHCLAWSHKGDQLLAGSDTGNVHVFDGATLAELKILVGHTGQVSAVAWSHNDSRIVSAGRDGYIRWWDADKGVELFKIPIAKSDNICELKFSAGGQWLAGRCESGKVHVWTTDQRATRNIVSIPPIVNKATSPNGKAESTLEALTTQITANPQDRDALKQRAKLHHLWHRWDQAADDYEQYLRLAPDDLGERQDLAITSLAAGREKDYFRHCGEIETRLSKLATPDILHTRAARILSLRPEGFVDGEKLLSMAAKTADKEPAKWPLVHPQIPLLFRLMRYDEALREARRIPRENLDGVTLAPVYAWEAMILWRLDRRQEARDALAFAQRHLKVVGDSRGKPWGAYDHIIEAEIVIREAEALVTPEEK